MPRFSFYFVTGFLLFTVISCKKKKDEPPVTNVPVDEVIYVDYLAMKPGNYWIYQDYKLDSDDGAAHALGTYDSVYVEKDTVVNGKTYHKYWEKQFGASSATFSLLRDSLGYIVHEDGYIAFSYHNLRDTFRIAYSYPSAAHIDTIKVTEQMGFAGASITVNAGTFITTAFRQIWYLPSSLPYGPTREYDTRRAPGIGVVLKTDAFFISSPEVYEKRLERYHIR